MLEGAMRASAVSGAAATAGAAVGRVGVEMVVVMVVRGEGGGGGRRGYDDNGDEGNDGRSRSGSCAYAGGRPRKRWRRIRHEGSEGDMSRTKRQYRPKISACSSRSKSDANEKGISSSRAAPTRNWCA